MQSYGGNCSPTCELHQHMFARVRNSALADCVVCLALASLNSPRGLLSVAGQAQSGNGAELRESGTKRLDARLQGCSATSRSDPDLPSRISLVPM